MDLGSLTVSGRLQVQTGSTFLTGFGLTGELILGWNGNGGTVILGGGGPGVPPPGGGGAMAARFYVGPSFTPWGINSSLSAYLDDTVTSRTADSGLVVDVATPYSGATLDPDLAMAGPGFLTLNGENFAMNLPAPVYLNTNLSAPQVNLIGVSLTGLGDLALTGSGSLWYNATFAGLGNLTVAAGASLTTMGDDRFDGQSLLNVGTVDTGTGSLLFFNGASATNVAGATWNLGSPGESALIGVVGSERTFLNEGTLVVPAGDEGAGAVGQIAGRFVNQNLTDVQVNGRLTLQGGGDINGTLKIEARGVLEMVGGTYVFNRGTSVQGDGILKVAGTAEMVLWYNLEVTRVVLAEGSRLLGFGPLTVTKQLDWNGGTMEGTGSTVLASTAIMNIEAAVNGNGHFYMELKEWWLDIRDGAKVFWKQGDVFLTHGAIIDNQVGGTFEIQCDQSLLVADGGGSFNNRGVFLKTAAGTRAADRTVIQTDFNNIGPYDFFLNAGLVDVEIGTVAFQGNGIHSGRFLSSLPPTPGLGVSRVVFDGLLTNQVFQRGTSLAGGGQIILEDGTINLDTAGIVTNEGDFYLRGGAEIQGPGEFDNRGTFTWQDGSITRCTLENTDTGKMVLSGDDDKILETTGWKNEGLVTWTGGRIIIKNTTALTNLGRFEANADNEIRADDNEGVFNRSSITNGDIDNPTSQRGLFIQTAGDTTTFVAPFRNFGTIQLQGHHFDFQGELRQYDGKTELERGTLTLNYTFRVEGGRLTGPGVIEGSVLMAGILDFGPVLGVLRILGDYTQTSTGTLVVKLQVNNNDPDSDLLRVDGTAALAGRLQATLLGGTLAQGYQFDFVTAAVATGGFADPTAGDLPPLPGTLQWQPGVTAAGAFLRVVP